MPGARVEVVHRSITIGMATNSYGNYVLQLGDYSNGESVVVRVLDGCGTGDVCQKTFTINSAGYVDKAIVGFDITGALACPPVSCSPCDCGSSGSSSYAIPPSEEKCAELFPAEECPNKVVYVPTMEDCKVVCEEEVCEEVPAVVPCEVCQTDEEKDNAFANILTGLVGGIILIAGLVLGRFSWFAGFSGLVKYRFAEAIKALRSGDYKEAEKQIQTGIKMQKTAVEKAKSGDYE